jgi:predicted metal-dependent peptidase
MKRANGRAPGQGAQNGSAQGSGGGSGSGKTGRGAGGANGSSGKGNKQGSGWAVGRAVRRVGGAGSGGVIWDDHSRWGTYEEDESYREAWVKRFEDAAEAISIRDPSDSRGLMPAFAKRLLSELQRERLNWRELLCNFVQEEVNDYSFSPPDRRYGDSDFFLPDFNDADEQVRNVLFMIDTSGSMSDSMITEAYSEIAGAISQFGGKLQGWLGFFDAAIVEPKPFVSLDDFLIIRPAGGGGTDFGIVFEYVRDYMKDDLPVSIVILTDGYAPFPKESAAMDIPVLWLINNENVNPPWGKVARIGREK